MQSAPTTPIGDERIDALLGPMQCFRSGMTTILNFSFPGAESLWSDEAQDYRAGGSAEPATGFATLKPAQRDAIRSVLQAWADVANLSFVGVADDATGSGVLRFGWTAASVNEQAHSYAEANAKAGDVWLNAAVEWDGLAPRNYGWSTLIHETGHVLGLDHFVFASSSDFGDAIQDFDPGATGNRLLLNAQITGTSRAPVSTYVLLEQFGSDTLVSFSSDGSSALGGVLAATL